MPGMMIAGGDGDLESDSDAEFEDMWLDMMVQHHEGAIEVAKDEQVRRSPASTSPNIETGQQAEIDHMRELLGA